MVDEVAAQAGLRRWS